MSWAVTVSRNVGISLWDALIVTAARTGGCSMLYLEDLNTGQVIDPVRILNPYDYDRLRGSKRTRAIIRRIEAPASQRRLIFVKQCEIPDLRIQLPATYTC